MTLENLLKGFKIISIVGNTDIEISDLFIDSRNVVKGGAFIAYKGYKFDGHNYINEAEKLGARTIFCERLPKDLNKNITYILFENISSLISRISNVFYDFPSKKIKVIGVTGTNGKTTTSFLLYQIFKYLGYKVGLISTIQYIINDIVTESIQTTPNILILNKLFHKMVKNGCSFCFMEVSSHSIVQNRIKGIDFNIGVFLNITQDHLDYHLTFKNYINAKKKFFDLLNNRSYALYNTDDKNGKLMVQNTKSKKYSFGINHAADFNLKIIQNTIYGQEIQINNKRIWTNFIGKFNAYNVLSAFAVGCLLNEDEEKLLIAISKASPPQGRFEIIPNNKNIFSIVDYAHTPDAVKNILEIVKSIKYTHSQIITVIGCGGNRDQDKRKKIGKISCFYSDKSIFTSDNPRFENPKDIIVDMTLALNTELKKKCLQILDRREAIYKAISIAKKNDFVIILGKGHEKYQEIKGDKLPFDDCKVLRKALYGISI